VAPDSYLRGVLADGARPFRHRARVRALLGLPDDTGVRVSFAPTPPGVGFTYLRHPYAHGEPYLPDEALATAPRWLDHAADDLFDPPAPATTVDDWPPAAADTPAGPRDGAAGSTVRMGEQAHADQPPAAHPAPATEPEPDSAVVIPGITVRPERHRWDEGEPGRPEPRRDPERAGLPWPATGRLDAGTAPPAPSDGPAPSSGGQVPPGAWDQPRQGGSAVAVGLPPPGGVGRAGGTAHRGDLTTPPPGGATAAPRGQVPPSTSAAPSPAGAGADYRPGVLPSRTAAGWRPSTAPARASTAARPAGPGGQPARPEPARPEPAPDVDWPGAEPATARRGRPVHRGTVSGPDAEGLLRMVEPPYRRAAPGRAAASGRAAAPEAPPARPTEAPAAAPQVVVVREPAPAAVGAAAFWERRYLSRLRARILR